MKTNKLLKKLMLFFITLSIVSCNNEIKELQAAANGEIGAYARVLTSSEDKSTNLFDENASEWDVKMEFVDEKAGSLVESYSLYVTFKDNTIENDTAPNYSITEEVLVGTWNKSSFNAGDTYPTLSIKVKSSEALTALGLDISHADGGDAFVYRGEIKLSDGRVFSSTNSGKGINSELFYNDAFGFSSPFVCVPSSPIAGDWKIEMIDVYSDGWDGAYILVTLDGTETKYTATGAGADHIITVPAGSTSLSWKYVPGLYESEHKFKVYAPSGNLVLSDGPSPATGLLALNLCNE